jgi:hypothetical protein
MNSPKVKIYEALRQLENALATQEGLNYVRDTCGGALQFTIEISRMIDDIERKERK